MGYMPKADLENIPGSFPKGRAPTVNDALKSQVLAWLNNLSKEDLAPNAIWRDFLALTDTFRTFHGLHRVHEVFQRLSNEKKRSTFELLHKHESRVVQIQETSWVDIDVAFQIPEGHLTGNCAAIVSVVLEPGTNSRPKIWMIRTWLENFMGHGHPDVPIQASWRPQNPRRDVQEDQVYDAIIIGGGQSGLGTAGRLNALGVEYILFDDRPMVGDSWTQRYDSLKWHTIREYGNLPFGRTFSPDDPTMPTSKLVGATYRAWAEKHGINIQPGTTVSKATWNNDDVQWTVYTTGQRGMQQWRCRNLVLAIGYCDRSPRVPEWASADKIKASSFKGVILHSAQYRNCHGFSGKNGIVVGAANTGHDVAEDMANVNMNVTMIQRKAAFTIPGSFLAHAFSRAYNLDKPIEAADRETITTPNKIQREMSNSQFWSSFRANPQWFDGLEQAGFKVDRYGELLKITYERLGGHFVDVGSGDRIIKGDIKVKSALDAPVEGLTPDGLRFADDVVIPADLIVLCTGFEMNHREDARRIIGDNADLMEDYWGLDGEGEVKGWAKLAGHPHLIYFGGEVRMARFFSRFVGLQIQKMVLGGQLRPFLEGKT